MGKTQLAITVKLPEDNPDGYVVSDVYAYQMDQNGNPITNGALSSKVVPSKAPDSVIQEFSDGRDYRNCTFIMPDCSVYIKVFITRTAQLTVTYKARNDEGKFSTENIPQDDNTYITCNNTSAIYGGELYPVIVENQYNVSTYTLTHDPASRTVSVLEKCRLGGEISFPKGYLIASVVATETAPDGTVKNLGYSFSSDKYVIKGGKYFYEADFSVDEMNTKAGYTYDLTVNLELATNILFESYHTSQDGSYALNKSECKAVLSGERIADNPTYEAKVPFASKETGNSDKVSFFRSKALTLQGSTNRFDYYALHDTTLTLSATPEGEDVVNEIEVYYEGAPNTLFDVTQTGKSEDGKTTYYSIPVTPKLGRKLVVQIYFGADLTGRLTIINRMVDPENNTKSHASYIDLPEECADKCRTNISIQNASYSLPIYYAPSKSWYSSTSTSAPSIPYRIAANSEGTVTAYAGIGYILESCEISYDSGGTFINSSKNSQQSRTKEYSLGKDAFTSDKSVIIRNTYRKAADLSIYTHRDSGYFGYTEVPYVFTATNPDPQLSNGPLYIGHSAYINSYSNAMANSQTHGFEVAEGSDVSLTLYEKKDFGYIVDHVELTKKDGDTETKVTKTRDELKREFNGTTCELTWENMINKSEHLTGSGYRVDIYYKADYVHIVEKCVTINNGATTTCQDPGRVTVEVEWPKDNGLIKDRNGGIDGYADDNDRYEGSYEAGNDSNSNVFAVGLLEGGTKYKVNITADSSHRIKEIWFGESSSTQKKYTENGFPEEGLDWGESYSFTIDKGTATNDYYLTVTYEHELPNNGDKPKPPPLQPEKARGLLAVNVYREKEDGSGYEISTVDKVDLSFLEPERVENSVPKLYENGEFKPLKPISDGSRDYAFSLPHKTEDTVELAGSATFSLMTGTEISSVGVTPKEGYLLDRIVLINRSTGQSTQKEVNLANGKYYMDTDGGRKPIKMTESHYVLNIYVNRPLVEVGTNNSPGSPKGTVSMKVIIGSDEKTEVMNSTDYMKAFKFGSGSNLELTAKPLTGYEFAYVLVGDSRGSMETLDSSQITINKATGAADIHLGVKTNDVYVQIQFRKIDDKNYSQISVKHYIKNKYGEYELYTLDTGGKVHVMGTQSSTPKPFLIDDANYDSFDLTTEGMCSAEAVAGTRITATVTAPENGIVSTFKATYSGASGASESTVTEDETGAYQLPNAVDADSTLLIEVYYDTGYHIYYYGNGAIGPVPFDEKIYHSGQSATVLGQGKMKKAHHTFKGWSLMNGSDNVDYKEGETVTFVNDDIYLYAVWEEDAQYRVIYHADDNDGGSVPVDSENYYLGDEATVLGNIAVNPLTKTGYTFAGWSLKKADDSTVSYNAGDKVTVTEDNLTKVDELKAVHLYVAWKESNYTLDYQPGEGHDSATIPTDEEDLLYTNVKDGHALSADTPTDTGYTFAGWKVNEVTDKLNPSDNVPFVSFDNGNKTATAVATWTENKYTLVYKPNAPAGATVSGMPSNVENLLYSTIKDGYTLSSDKPTATGYIFVGWQVNEVGGTLNNPSKVPFKSFNNDNKTATATAIWRENNYTLTYEKNTTEEVTDMPDPSSTGWKHTEVGGKLTLSDSTPKRTGYTFKGWDENKNATNPTYNKETEFTKVANDVTLYAIWTENTYTLDYQNGGHSNAVIPSDEENLLYTDIKGGHALSSDKPTDTGYTFAGWKVNEVTDKLNPSDNVPFVSFDNGNKTATAVATWTVNQHKVIYEITVPDDIDYTKPEEAVKNFGETVKVADKPVPVPVKEGTSSNKYTFSGWSSDDVTISNDGEFTMPDKDVIIRGSFNENGKVTLTYDANGADSGTAPAQVSDYVKVVEKIKGQGDLLKTGYTFDGWNASKNGNGAVYEVGTTYTFTENTTIFAKWIPNDYHVRYYDINGNELNALAETHYYNTDFTVRSNSDIPIVAGKAVSGWVLLDDGMTVDAENKPIGNSGTYKMPAGDVKFKAVYTDIDYTVTYQVSDAPSSYTVPETKTYKYKDNVTVEPVPNIEGYNFYGWESAQIENLGASFSMPTQNVVITGRFTPKDKVTLSYDGNGATSGKAPDSITRYDKVVTKISDKGSLERSGYTFTGWKDKAGKDYEINSQEYTFTVDTTLYAQWKKSSFDVEYYEADGTTLIAKRTYEYQASVNVGEGISPTQIGEGKEWNGKWVLINTEQLDADGNKISDRTNYPMPAETVKYKAVLDPKLYTVKYEVTGNIPDGYTAPTDSNTYIHGGLVNVEAAPEREGYTFEGWTYKDKVYAKDTANASFTITENVTLVGIWTKNSPNTITVTYQSGVECENENDPLAKKYTFNTPINEDYTVLDNIWYDRPGYTFKNWVVVEPEVTGIHIIDNIVAFFAGPANLGQKYVGGDIVTALSEDITLEAQWEPIHYTVLYYGNGATGGTAPIDSNSYSYNDTAVVKDKNDLVKDGFTFKGWSTSPLGTGSALYLPNDEITITSDVTLYAIWSTEIKPNNYRVIYDGNGATSGSVPEDNTIYNGGETVTVKDKGDLEKDGCTFKEWNTLPDGSGTVYNPNDKFTMPQNDVVLYAIWIDSNGNVVVSPGTGESNFGTLLALNISIVSLIAIAIITVRMLKKRRKSEAC